METNRGTGQVEPPKGRLLRAIDELAAQLWSWGGLYFLIAISLGLALWPLTDLSLFKHIAVKNDLTVDQRHRALLAIGASFALTTGAYLAVWLRRRKREPGLALGRSIVETNRWAFILLIAPMLTALGAVNIESKHPVFTTFLSLVITALVMVFVYRLLGLRSLSPPADPFVPARRPNLARAVLWGGFLGYSALFSYFTLLDHWNLSTTIYDLGIYDNILWQTAHGFFLDCTFIKGGDHSVAHFDPILWVLAQFYRFFPRAETLLVVQTVWLASGVFPLWKLAVLRLRNEWVAACLVLVYLLSPGLHGINMFDFHSLALIVPMVMWAVYALDSGSFRGYWVAIAALLVTREDVSLINCFIAAYALLSGRTRTGLVTVAVSLIYLVAIKRFAMPDPGLLMAANKAYSYTYYYEEMIPHAKEGVRGLLITLVTNPLWALTVLFKEEKLLFLLHLVLPLLGLPFVAGRKAILTVYGMLFIGLATRKHVYSLSFHYSSLLLPMLFAALPDGLARVTDSRKLAALGLERARLAWTLVLGMLVSSTLVTVKYGGIFPNATFRAGWSRLIRTPSPEMKLRYEKLREWITVIGPDAGVSSTSDIGPHISNRRRAYHWPSVGDAEFMIVRYEHLKKEDPKKLERLVKRHKFQLVEEALGMRLYQRTEPPEPASPPAARKGRGDAKDDADLEDDVDTKTDTKTDAKTEIKAVPTSSTATPSAATTSAPVTSSAPIGAATPSAPPATATTIAPAGATAPAGAAKRKTDPTGAPVKTP